MQITFYSIGMTLLWSSVLIVLFYLLRKSSRMIDICSVSGMIVLYVFCLIRLFVPVELPGVRVVPMPAVYNRLCDLMLKEIWLPGSVRVPVYGFILALWFAGIALAGGKLWRNYHQSIGRLLALAGRKADIPEALYAEIFGGWRRKPAVQEVESGTLDSPISFGIRKRYILLPARAEGYPESELRYILLHEAAHLRNGDMQVQLLVNLLCVVYWWNPFVYLLRRDLGQTFELRADRTVIRACGQTEIADYLEAILKVYRKNHGERGRGAYQAAGLLGETRSRKNLRERFAVAERDGYGRGHNGIVIVGIISAILLLVSYAFIFQSDYDRPQYGYRFTEEEGYLLHLEDDTYKLYMDGKLLPIEKESIPFLLKEGLTLKEERNEQ